MASKKKNIRLTKESPKVNPTKTVSSEKMKGADKNVPDKIKTNATKRKPLFKEKTTASVSSYPLANEISSRTASATTKLSYLTLSNHRAERCNTVTSISSENNPNSIDSIVPDDRVSSKASVLSEPDENRKTQCSGENPVNVDGNESNSVVHHPDLETPLSTGRNPASSTGSRRASATANEIMDNTTSIAKTTNAYENERRSIMTSRGQIISLETNERRVEYNKTMEAKRAAVLEVTVKQSKVIKKQEKDARRSQAQQKWGNDEAAMRDIGDLVDNLCQERKWRCIFDMIAQSRVSNSSSGLLRKALCHAIARRPGMVEKLQPFLQSIDFYEKELESSMGRSNSVSGGSVDRIVATDNLPSRRFSDSVTRVRPAGNRKDSDRDTVPSTSVQSEMSFSNFEDKFGVVTKALAAESKELKHDVKTLLVVAQSRKNATTF